MHVGWVQHSLQGLFNDEHGREDGQDRGREDGQHLQARLSEDLPRFCGLSLALKLHELSQVAGQQTHDMEPRDALEGH